MDAFRFELNPSSACLPRCNAVLNGNVRTRSYVVNSYQTTLCVKSVSRGSAWYRTPRGRYLVDAETFLVLNRGQEYSLEIAARSDTETVCPFFQPGFLGHVAGCKSARPERLLDEPPTAGEDPEFFERLYSMKQGPVAARLEILRAGLHGPGFCRPWLEDQLYGLAGDLLVLRDGVQREVAAFPGSRLSTREELYRRLPRLHRLLLRRESVGRQDRSRGLPVALSFSPNLPPRLRRDAHAPPASPPPPGRMPPAVGHRPTRHAD
jgi:hypothetical protein